MHVVQCHKCKSGLPWLEAQLQCRWDRVNRGRTSPVRAHLLPFGACGTSNNTSCWDPERRQSRCCGSLRRAGCRVGAARCSWCRVSWKCGPASRRTRCLARPRPTWTPSRCRQPSRETPSVAAYDRLEVPPWNLQLPPRPQDHRV